MKYIKSVLIIWGWVCLVLALVSLIQILFLDPANPTGIGILISGAAGFEEWIGMGLISLGIARVIALLEKK